MRKKIIIRLIIILLAVIAVLCLVMHFANKQQKAKFEVSDVIGNAGEEITITVKLLEDFNFVAANFEFLYDSSKMEYIKYEETEILKNAAMSIVNNDKNSDKILIAYVGDPQNETDIVKQGELIKMTFRLKDEISNEKIKPEFKCATLKEKNGQDVLNVIKQGTIIIK